MLKLLFFAFLWGVFGYGLGVAAGVTLVYTLSVNRHDLDMEAVMTGFFFVGPLAAAIFFLTALLVYWRRSRVGSLIVPPIQE